jgi:hypothetical protein
MEHEFGEQEEIILVVKEALDKIQQAKKKQLKEHHLFQLLAFLISSSNDIAQEGDYYEAAGRLYSAAYYLEEFYPKEAKEIYIKSNEYYISYFNNLMKTGAVNEAANVALRISNIFNEKLNDNEKYKEYISKSIGLIANQIEILNGVGTHREICGKYQILSMLYMQIEDWENVIITAKLALEIAIKIKDYSIISNAYNDLFTVFQNLEQPKNAHNVLYESMDYFSKEASEYELKQELLPLSQLYQIIKNIHSQMRNFKKFQLYSRKEAGVYITLAKLGMLYNTGYAQIASYYRGAALCYRETEQNELDCASCFFLAGDYYLEAKKYMEASINYEDAAFAFEKIDNLDKTYELYIKAGEYAAKTKSLQPAIENFMSAYEVLNRIEKDPRKVLNLLVKNLKLLGKIEEASQNYFAAATLQLEAAIYYEKYPERSSENLKEILLSAQKNYWNAITSDQSQHKRSIIAYTCALSAILSKILGKAQATNDSMKILNKIDSKTGKSYKKLSDLILVNLNSSEDLDLKQDKKMERLFNNSEEIKKAFELKFIQKISNLSPSEQEGQE